MEAVVSTYELERCALREQLGCGARHEELLRIQLVEDLPGIERIKFDAESGVCKLWAAHDFLDPLLQGRGELRRHRTPRKPGQNKRCADRENSRSLFLVHGVHVLGPSDLYGTTCRAAGALTREANSRRNHLPVRIVLIGVANMMNAQNVNSLAVFRESFSRLLPYTVANCAIQLVMRTVSCSIRSRLTKYPRPGALGTWIAPFDVTSTSGSIMSSCQ